jgi:hypothetical protein
LQVPSRFIQTGYIPGSVLGLPSRLSSGHSTSDRFWGKWNKRRLGDDRQPTINDQLSLIVSLSLQIDEGALDYRLGVSLVQGFA